MTQHPPLTERQRKDIASLQQRKYRERLRQFVVEGTRSVRSASDAGAPIVALVGTITQLADPALQTVLGEHVGHVFLASDEQMRRLSDVETPPGLLAVVEIREEPADELARYDRILALDGVQDPGNVGTLLRTAAWFGIEAIVAGPGTADFFSPKVVRAAMGGLWDVHLARTHDLPGTLGKLTSEGMTTYAADLKGVCLDTWAPVHPSVVVLGSEAHGPSPAVLSRAEMSVNISGNPDRRGVESLNVAVAGGILMHRWSLSERRR